MTRIVIADDHDVVRRGIRSLLETASDLQVTAEASTGDEAVKLADLTHADLVIMDINMPVLNGLDATRMILKLRPNTQVLILSMHESEQLVRDILESGARGYLLKSDAGQELVRAIRALQNKEVYFTSKVSEVLLSGFLGNKEKEGLQSDRGSALTTRERQIVQLLVEGNSNKEVAGQLDISVKTVESHRSRIMEKLNLKAFSELVRYAIRNQIASA
jgi:DNA-binding NarL/FixJ family response regulator